MAGKAVVSLTTGLEDPERVTVAFLVAVGAAEQGRPTLMFLTKEATRLALWGVATAVACEGCPPLAELVDRYAKAGGRYLVCPICFDARKLDKDQPRQLPIPSIPASSLHLGQTGNRDGSRTGWNRRPHSAVTVPPSTAARAISSLRA